MYIPDKMPLLWNEVVKIIQIEELEGMRGPKTIAAEQTFIRLLRGVPEPVAEPLPEPQPEPLPKPVAEPLPKPEKKLTVVYLPKPAEAVVKTRQPEKKPSKLALARSAIRFGPPPKVDYTGLDDWNDNTEDDEWNAHLFDRM